MSNEKRKVLEMIARDMESDAKNLDGEPFTGATIGKYLGNQGAAIAALANIIKFILDGPSEKK